MRPLGMKSGLWCLWIGCQIAYWSADAATGSICNEAGTAPYTLQPGQFLSAVASSCSISVDAIVAATSPPIVNPDEVQAGQQVCVPTSCSLLASGAASPKPEASPEAASPKPETSPEPDASPQSTPHVAAAPTAGSGCSVEGTFPYALQPMDTLSKVATTCDTSVDAIVQSTTPRVQNQDQVQAGQQVCVPATCSLAAASPAPGSETPASGPPGSLSLPNIISQGSRGGGGSAVACTAPINGTYIIQPADGLNAISATCNVDLTALLSANPQITDQDVILAGSTLCVPPDCSLASAAPTAAADEQQYLGPSSSSTPGCNTTHIVQPGDRCWQLWNTYGLTQDDFASLNPDVICTNLQVDQPLCMSSSTGIPPRAPCLQYHPLQENDTCGSVASAFSLSLPQLQQLNAPLDCTNLTDLRARMTVCIRNSIVTPVAGRVYCSRWTTAPLDTTCSALLESVKVPDLTRTTLESLNPNLNCSTPIGSAWQTNQTSVCVAGRAVDPEGNYDDVANPARTTLLGQIVTALAAVQPGLTDLYRKFTDMPSVQTNDALAVGLRITLNSSAAVQPAAQLETRLGRPALQNALFPQGSDSICSFLQEHNPDSQTRQCLCGSSQSPVLTCAAQAPEDIQQAARKALASNGQTTGTTPTSSSEGAPPSDSAAGTTAESPTSAPDAPGPPSGGAPPSGGGQCITPTGSVGGEPASNPSADSQVDPAVLDQIAIADEAAFTFSKTLKPLCDLSGSIDLKKLSASPDSKIKDKYKLQSIVKKFKASPTGKALKDISETNTTAANIRRDIKQLVEPSNICCTPRVCIPIVEELLSVCVKGGFCTPNFELHSISGSLVVCNAVDLTDVAADITAIAADVSQQQCYVISDGESDILNPFVEQKATLTIGLCPLPDLFAAISAFDGGFTGCADITVDFLYLKGQIDIKPPAIPLGPVALQVDVLVKAWDVPGGLCSLSAFTCQDFCTMSKGDVHGKMQLKVAGLLMGIADTGEKVVNAITDVFHVKHVPPPNPVIKEWPFGNQGKCKSSPDVVASQPLNIFAAYVTDWAQYRNITDSSYKGEAVKRPDWCKDYGYTPSHLNGALYTHLLYAFAKIDSSSFAVVDVESNDKELQAEVQALKASSGGLKTLISIGGWSFSTGTEAFSGTGSEQVFPAMAGSTANRAAFIKSAISYAQDRGFDGIDIDWEFPAAVAGSPCTGAAPGGCAACTQQIRDFTSLLSEMKPQMGTLLLSVALRATPHPELHYQLSELVQHVDWINLMSYDYIYDPHPLHPHPAVTHAAGCMVLNAQIVMAGALDAYLAAGVPANKIALGLATYGRTFQLTGDGDQPGVVPASGVPHAAQDTCSYSDGVLAYYEIKRFVKPEDLKTDPVAEAAYARYNGSSWVGFDTPDTHKHKMCFARYRQLAGVFFWDTDLDDGQELIKAARGNYDHADCRGFTLASCAAGGGATGVVALQ